MAADAGLYVLARPGPYINGELNAGGFPGWLTSSSGKARYDDAVYLAAVDEWFTAIDGILAKHQVTNGGGTLLLYQIENEYTGRSAADSENVIFHRIGSVTRAIDRIGVANRSFAE